MRFHSKVIVASAAVASICVAGAPAAFAHEQRQVGAYHFTVGWGHEPTYVGATNNIELLIHDSHGQPIDTIGTPPTLQVEVVFGSQTSTPLPLAASYDPDTGLGTRGEFDASIVPTQAGNYKFHFFGTLGSQKIDQLFTSGPSTFNTVEDPTSVEFPAKVPALAEVATLASRAQARADSARQRADSAHSAGVLGVILGAAGIVVGGGVGAIGLLAGRRRMRST